ncbi:hypothetical protein [Anaeromicrobium sediminis]|uniref:S1 motif domain-containing protein n=1 Tax=Anaeromicrobium sediminis TaxID=1478221 RepID=A0A267M8N4_9FIRM|nr:hypothetical protein [Anaeromicrobium sediminis]PAB55944.1 hypothetical protein CCE28_21405 [Anaeromicrobium sediminis]
MKKAISVILILLIFIVTISYGGVNDPYRNGYIEGYLKEKYDNKVKIEEYDGTIHEIELARNVVLKIDDILVKPNDMKEGMEVYGDIKGKRLITLEAYSTEKLGYISPQSKTLRGVVKKIDRDTLNIKLITGEEKLFFTSPITIVNKSGESIGLDSLYIGDEVKLYFDEYDTDIISRMEIRNNSIKVKDIYKAKLVRVDEIENKITLENIYNFTDGKWSEIKPMATIEYDYDTPMYLKAQSISNDKLKYFVGKTVYLAVEDFFGEDKIKKLVLQEKYSKIYSDKIRKINYFSDSLELRNNKNLTLSEGTIILKDGRLVEKSIIDEENDALIIADGYKDSLHASVIDIYNTSINNSNIGQKHIYAGRMNRIFEDSVYLNDFYILKENEWYSFRTEDEDDEKRLYYDEDTKIYNLEEKEIISAKEFFQGNFSVDEDDDEIDDRDLKDWYTYFYTDGDRITVGYIMKDLDSLGKERITTGHVQKVENSSSTGWTLTLMNSKDWSDHKEKWIMKNSSININLEKAMIIKDDKIITPEELLMKDSLYIIRDDYDGKIVIVK